MNPRIRRTAACLVAAALPGAALAQSAGPERALKLFLDQETTGLPGRVEVEVGAIDPRIDLSGCARIEPFLPPGKRLWGRTWVGARCTQGTAQTAYFPVHVKIYGPALIANRMLAAGTAPEAPDVRSEEVELTREAPGALAGLDAVADRVLARPVAAGQMLRADFFRVRPAVAAGDNVKLVYAGPGFQVSAEGRAMGSAGEGQPVRVQTAAGKTLTGTARKGRVVQLSY